MTSKNVIPIGILKQKLYSSSAQDSREVLTKRTLPLSALSVGSLTVYGNHSLMNFNEETNSMQPLSKELSLHSPMGNYDRKMLIMAHTHTSEEEARTETIQAFLSACPDWFNTVKANHLIGVHINEANISEVFGFSHHHPKTSAWVFLWVYNAYQDYIAEESHFGQ